MPVFLLLAVVWAAVLVPPLLQARRQARPIASIRSFRSQLWSLQRATPTYGDAYGAYRDGYDDGYGDGYGDDAYTDAYDDAYADAGPAAYRSAFGTASRATYGAVGHRPSAGEPGDGRYDEWLGARPVGPATAGSVAAVHALAPERHGGPAVAPGVVGTVVHSPDEGVPGGLAGPASAAQRAYTYRRRRQVLTILVLVTGGTTAGAVLAGGAWIVGASVTGALLLVYLGLLVRRGRREAERLQKVRYLTPIRAPRPSVVVIGSGAAHS